MFMLEIEVNFHFNSYLSIIVLNVRKQNVFNGMYFTG